MESEKLLANSEEDLRKHEKVERNNCVLKVFAIITMAVVVLVIAGGFLEMFLLSSKNPIPETNERTPKATTFKAAVYEQTVVTVYNATTRKEALVAMAANLADMDTQAKAASKEVRYLY